MLAKIVGWVRSGRVRCVMLAPRCSSFCIAKSSRAAVRGLQHLWGLPGLAPTEHSRVEEGSIRTKVAFKIMHACGKHLVPCIFEHPSTSLACHLPETLAVERKYVGQRTVADQCQVGTPWRKRTMLFFVHANHLELGKVSSAQHSTCSGEHGFCSRTGKTHVWLRGAAITRAAACLPRLNTAIARALLPEQAFTECTYLALSRELRFGS